MQGLSINTLLSVYDDVLMIHSSWRWHLPKKLHKSYQWHFWNMAPSKVQLRISTEALAEKKEDCRIVLSHL